MCRGGRAANDRMSFPSGIAKSYVALPVAQEMLLLSWNALHCAEDTPQYLCHSYSACMRPSEAFRGRSGPVLSGMNPLHAHATHFFNFLDTRLPIYRSGVLPLSRECFLYIYSTNIFNDFFLYLLAPSPFIPPENVVYCLKLPFFGS